MTGNSRIHLLCPGLELPYYQKGDPAMQQVDAPNLRWLLARAARRQSACIDFADRLLSVFGTTTSGGNPSIAALTHYMDFGEWSTDVVLRADPVFLVPQGDRLAMEPIPAETLGTEEANAIELLVNGTFYADGKRLRVGPSGRWYLYLDQPLDVTHTPLSLARIGNLFECLPQGHGAMAWRQWYTELQMLLHNHPVNEEREARGHLPISSLWVWGEGERPTVEAKLWDHVYTNDPLATALGCLSDADVYSLPSNLGDIMARHVGEKVLVVMPPLDLAQDVVAWCDQLRQLDLHWFAPLRQRLTQGNWAHGAIDLANGMVFDLAPSLSWRLWRRQPSLASLLG